MATLSLVLAAIASASPAGTEYLPQVPQSASGSGSSGGAGQNPSAAAAAHDTASSGDDSSGSVLLNPLALLLIAGVVVAATAMILRRRQADGQDEPDSERAKQERGSEGPRTPEGEIVASSDKSA